MGVTADLFTRVQYDLLPEGFPAELVEGCLLREPSPSFGHQRITLAIAGQLRRLVGARRVAVAPLDVPIDDHNVYQPDVVVFWTPIADDAKPDDRGPPLLVVEVLSPSTADRDRGIKRVRLLEAGVPEVWLVDPALRTVQVHENQPDPTAPRRTARDGLVRSAALPGFALDVGALFAD